MITLERNYAITHAMHLNKRLSLKHAAYIMIGAWSFSILLASLPLVGQYFTRRLVILESSFLIRIGDLDHIKYAGMFNIFNYIILEQLVSS